MQTEFPFTLPRGYVDSDGSVHRDGVMKLSTAFDEVAPMKDPRVQTNPSYLVIILLSRVITKLGDLTHINPKVIEGLFSADLAFLQDFYRRINENGHSRLGDVPALRGEVRSGDECLGGMIGYPSDALFEEIAFIAYYLHWPREQIMGLDHRERQRWVAEISRINQELNESAKVES